MNKKGERSMKKTREEKGITLIALIITIVVLMILAAVAINSITNEGILSQSGSTANQYNQAVLNEQTSLQDYEDMLTAANGGYKDKSFEVGDLVKVGTEEFYVIEDKTSLGKVLLLAKGNIDTETLVQDGENNYVAFSTEVYWTGYNGSNIEETIFPIPESHIAAKAAYDYGVKLGGKGRLITFDERNGLFNPETLAYPEFINGNYWTKSRAGEYVWLISGGGSLDVEFGASNMVGVRPVIEISKSKVTKVQ